MAKTELNIQRPHDISKWQALNNEWWRNGFLLQGQKFVEKHGWANNGWRREIDIPLSATSSERQGLWRILLTEFFTNQRIRMTDAEDVRLSFMVRLNPSNNAVDFAARFYRLNLANKNLPIVSASFTDVTSDGAQIKLYYYHPETLTYIDYHAQLPSERSTYFTRRQATGEPEQITHTSGDEIFFAWNLFLNTDFSHTQSSYHMRASAFASARALLSGPSLGRTWGGR